MKPRPISLLVSLAAALLAGTSTARAHHSYAMFDTSKSTIVQGSVAKIEWVNPHVFVWIYVKKPAKQDEYDLYAFENGPIGLLTRYGWTKDTFRVGDKVSVQYFALKDGRTGGYLIKVIRADGTEQIGDPHAPGVARELAKSKGTPVSQPAAP